MSDEVERLEKQQEQIKARLQRAKAKERSAKRKADTRSKIIFGGFLASLMREDKKLQNYLYKKIYKLNDENKDKAILIEHFFKKMSK